MPAMPIHFEAERLPRTDEAGERVDVTLLCADIVGFTEMVGRLGDDGALAVMRGVAGTVRSHARRHGGEVLEIRGDSFLLAFASARSSVRYAIRVIRALATEPGSHAGEQVRVRMAIHTGSVLRDGGGYFGRSLILAYRLLSQVGAGAIAMTPSAADRLPQRWRERASVIGCFRPKGFGCEVPYLLLTPLHFGARRAQIGVGALH
jgi:class 3 adenylate cyclase